MLFLLPFILQTYCESKTLLTKSVGLLKLLSRNSLSTSVAEYHPSVHTIVVKLGECLSGNSILIADSHDGFWVCVCFILRCKQLQTVRQFFEVIFDKTFPDVFCVENPPLVHHPKARLVNIEQDRSLLDVFLTKNIENLTCRH